MSAKDRTLSGAACAIGKLSSEIDHASPSVKAAARTAIASERERPSELLRVVAVVAND